MHVLSVSIFYRRYLQYSQINNVTILTILFNLTVCAAWWLRPEYRTEVRVLLPVQIRPRSVWRWSDQYQGTLQGRHIRHIILCYHLICIIFYSFFIPLSIYTHTGNSCMVTENLLDTKKVCCHTLIRLQLSIAHLSCPRRARLRSNNFLSCECALFARSAFVL